MEKIGKEISNKQKLHSAEYFGESRNYWWNTDFLALMAKRLSFHKFNNILDVGCGIGHWGQVLSPFFSSTAQLVGIDREAEWVNKAKKRALDAGLADRFSYQIGNANKLEFNENTFDFVTCQTVLIHLKQPQEALKEMVRVLKPGGMLLIVEPNNFANRAVADNITAQLSVEKFIERLKFGLIIERGKSALGLGNNSVGDLIPGYLSELGEEYKVENIKVYLSDYCIPLFKPYTNYEQVVNINQMKEWSNRKFIGWDREEVLSYFIAGGGRREDFEYYLNLLIKDGEDIIKSIEADQYHTARGGIFYLIAAQKPLKS